MQAVRMLRRVDVLVGNPHPIPPRRRRPRRYRDRAHGARVDLIDGTAGGGGAELYRQRAREQTAEKTPHDASITCRSVDFEPVADRLDGRGTRAGVAELRAK